MHKYVIIKELGCVVFYKIGVYRQFTCLDWCLLDRMWKTVEKKGIKSVSKFFFSGSTSAKVDDKNRFVLPQEMRLGLVEEGKIEVVLALGMGGCLAIYKTSEIDTIVALLQGKQHIAKYRKFFTLFFSTLHKVSPDKLGRITLPPILKKSTGIGSEIVIAGVMNKIEIWPKAKFEEDLALFRDQEEELSELTEELLTEKVFEKSAESAEKPRDESVELSRESVLT